MGGSQQRQGTESVWEMMSWRQWTFWACCVEQFVLFCGDTCLNMMISLHLQARLSSLWLQDEKCLTESTSWQAPVLTVWRGHHVTLWWSSTHVCQCNMWLWRHVHEHAALTSVQQMLKLWGPLPSAAEQCDVRRSWTERERNREMRSFYRFHCSEWDM